VYRFMYKSTKIVVGIAFRSSVSKEGKNDKEICYIKCRGS